MTIVDIKALLNKLKKDEEFFTLEKVELLRQVFIASHNQNEFPGYYEFEQVWKLVESVQGIARDEFDPDYPILMLHRIVESGFFSAA